MNGLSDFQENLVYTSNDIDDFEIRFSFQSIDCCCPFSSNATHSFTVWDKSGHVGNVTVPLSRSRSERQSMHTKKFLGLVRGNLSILDHVHVMDNQSIHKVQYNDMNVATKRVIPLESHECCDKMCDSNRLPRCFIVMIFVFDVMNHQFHVGASWG